MATDYKLDYWEETLGQALCEIGAYNKLTSEERKELAQAIASAAEVQGEYFGTNNIPDPRDTEIENLKARHKEELAEMEADSDVFRRTLASNIGVEARRLYNHRGHVEILRQ
jgi:hypothetical protein